MSRVMGDKVGAQRIIVALGLVILVAGCRQDMHDQPRLEPFEASAFFPNGAASRLPVPNTVARGFLNDDEHLYAGTVNGELATTFPFEMTAEVLQRGRTRYEIACAPCHGRVGDARGMIVAYGFTEPPSLVTADLGTWAPGLLFDIITYGSGDMPDYADQISVRDRWAIVGYLRALQFSQNAPVADLPQQDRDALELSP